MERYFNYINAVIANPDDYSITIQQLVNLQCEVFDRQDDQDYAYYFDEETAYDVVSFIESLKHFEGEFRGKNFILQDWQVFLIGSVYGTKKKENGYRRYSKIYIQLARKNGKTFLAAALGLYEILSGPAKQTYAVATKKDQAKESLKKMIGIIKMIPNWQKFINIHGKKNPFSVSTVNGDSSFTPLASDSNTLDGLNPSFAIIDEYHSHRDDSLVQIFQNGMGAQREPILFIITTAGDNKLACYEEYSRCKKVLSGEFVDEALFPMIYELDDDDHWEDESKWGKANPCLGQSTTLEALQKIYIEATQKHSTEIQFRIKNVNQWTTDSSDIWIPQKIWEANKSHFNTDLLKGRRCYGGIDLGSTSDLTSYTLYFPYNDKIIAIHKVYIPSESIEQKTKFENSNYPRWISDKLITVTPGPVTDYQYLINDLKKDIDQYEIVEMGYDPYKAGNIISFIENEGIILIPIKQGMTHFSEPCKAWERSVMLGKLCDDNPVMEWCVSNAEIKPDNHENIVPLKKAGKRNNKIDLVVSSVIAHKIMMDNEDGLRDAKLKENPLNIWAQSMDDVFFEDINEHLPAIVKDNDNGPPPSSLKPNPLNDWANEYLKQIGN